MFGFESKKDRLAREAAEREERYARLRAEARASMRDEQVRTGPIPRDEVAAAQIEWERWRAARHASRIVG